MALYMGKVKISGSGSGSSYGTLTNHVSLTQDQYDEMSAAGTLKSGVIYMTPEDGSGGGTGTCNFSTSAISGLIEKNNATLSTQISSIVTTSIIHSEDYSTDFNEIRNALQNWDTDNLPQVGSQLKCASLVLDNYFDVVGYDINVPEYVGYRRETQDIYVRVWDDTALSTRSVKTGDATYYRSYVSGASYSTFTSTGKTITATSGTKTYGNLNPFTVPEKITVNGNSYVFCGHTMTIMSGKVIGKSEFDNLSGSVWSSSSLRSLINGEWNGFSKSKSLFQNTLKSCNLTYGGNSLDQFFIPSAIELNGGSDLTKDAPHSKFKSFGDQYFYNLDRVKNNITWFTRSKNDITQETGTTDEVLSIVFTNGSITFTLSKGGLYYGVVPVCVIG